MALMAWGENIQIFMELGFPTQVFTLDSATDGVLDSDFLDGTLVGEDVSAYAQDVSISRGRSDQLQNFNAGTFSVRLLNRDRRFDPINQSSPYWNSTLGVSGVAPRRKVTVLSNGVALFSGRITDIDVSYEPNQPSATSENSYVTITASDDFVLLANTYTSSAITPTEVLSGTRVTEILDLPEVNYPATRNIDAGSAALGGGATFEIAANTNVLTYLQSVGASEQGYFFVAANGDLTFTDRITSAFSSPVAYFSDTGTNIPYTNLSVMYGQEFLYNKVVCQVEGGTDQVANDVASQTEYGISTLNLSGLLLVDDAAALTLASELLERYKVPEYRFDKLQTVYNRLGSVDQATLTAVDIGDVVSITRTYPTGTPATVTKEYSIENIRHVITPNSHTVEYGLSVADIVYPFILAGFPVPTVTRTNILPNPSFETNTTNWTAYGATISRVAGTFGTGSWVGQVVYNNTLGGGGYTEAITVTPNQSLTASATVLRTVGTRSYYVLLIYYNGATELVTFASSVNTCASPTRMSATGTAPANATHARVFVYSSTASVVGDTYQVDSVLLETGSTLLPYFDGTYVDAYTGYGLDSKGWNGIANASSSTASWFVGSSRTNLVPNPSFEVNTNGWFNRNGSSIARTTSQFYSGSASMQITTSASVNNGITAAPYIPVAVGSSYTLSAYAKIATGTLTNCYALIIWVNSGGTEVSRVTGTFTTITTDWTRLTASGVAPAGAVNAEISIVRNTAGAGSVWFVDGILFEQSASVLPYFDGTYVYAYSGYGLYSKAWNGTANASTSTANWYVGNSRTNFVTNPSLETNATGWSAASSPQVRSTDFSRSGVASFKVTMSSSTDNNIMVNTPNFSGTGNATFSVYAYIPVGSTLAGQSISVFPEGGTATQTAVSATSAILVPDSWVRISVTRNVTAAGTMVMVARLGGLPSTFAGQNIYFDDALAEFSSSALPYFDGTYADTYTGYTLESQAWNGAANASTSTANWGLTSSYVGTPMDSDYALS
jgi:hypothetical protein